MKVRSIIYLWLFWCLLVISFQFLAYHRVKLVAPDRALPWTEYETVDSNDITRQPPYLNDQFMNNHIAWDSAYYLSIATVGYDDPAVPQVKKDGKQIAANYAFMPLYPMLIRATAAPMNLFLSPVAAATLAGVLVSLLGTLAAMLSLQFLLSPFPQEGILSADAAGSGDGFRAAYYLVIFPSSFFFAQVYTEGLFAGLSLACLALIRHKQFAWAALCAILAAWTRGVGFVLAIPLLWAWATNLDLKNVRPLSLIKNDLPALVLACLPVAAFALWRYSILGRNFFDVEAIHFGRSALVLSQSLQSWIATFKHVTWQHPQTSAYFLLEYLAIFVAFTACLATLRKHPAISIYGLAILAIPMTSGDAQSMVRYAAVVPSIYMAASRLGRRPVFDRVWSTASVLLFALLTIIFTRNQWVA